MYPLILNSTTVLSIEIDVLPFAVLSDTAPINEFNIFDNESPISILIPLISCVLLSKKMSEVNVASPKIFCDELLPVKKLSPPANALFMASFPFDKSAIV